MLKLLFLAVLLISPYSYSQQTKQPVPPVAGKAKDADKGSKSSDQKQTVTVEFPSTLNVNVGGKLDTGASETKKQTQEEPSRWTEPISIATWLLVFVTGGLVYVAIRQFSISRQQLRAYVSVMPGFLYEQERFSGFFEARPNIKNGGQTPAHNVRYRGITRVLPRILPPNFAFHLPPHSNPSVSNLGPDDGIAIWPITEKFYTPDELHEILIASSQALYTYGIVSYEDVFGREWETSYCFFFIWGSKGLPVWVTGTQHNRAT